METITVPATAKRGVFNQIDVHVGARIRARRTERGVTQAALSAEIGMAFQQVAKYETGANRISVAILYDIARALKTNIGYFFQGLDDVTADEPIEEQFFATPGASQLATAYIDIQPAMRDGLVTMAKGLASSSAGWRSPAAAARRKKSN